MTRNLLLFNSGEQQLWLLFGLQRIARNLFLLFFLSNGIKDVLIEIMTDEYLTRNKK